MKAVEILILIGAVAVVAGVIIAGLWKKKKGKGGDHEEKKGDTKPNEK